MLSKSRRDWLKDAYEQYGTRVYKMIRYKLSSLGLDPEDAGDILQDVFLIAAQQYAKLVNHPNLLGWLLKTAVLSTQNYARKQRVRMTRQAYSVDSMNSPDIEDKDAATRLLDVFEAVPDKEHVVVELKAQMQPSELELYERRFELDMPVVELAVAFGTSENAIRIRLSRLVKKLSPIVEKIIDDMK